MKKNIAFVLVMLLSVTMMGCPGMQIGGENDTPEQKQAKAYMAARKEFALTLQKYNDYYATAGMETQVKWKEKIDPMFRQVDKALDGWMLAIDNNWDPAVQEQTFLKLKSDLIILLVDVFVNKEG